MQKCRNLLNSHVGCHLLKNRWGLDISVRLPVTGCGVDAGVHNVISQVNDDDVGLTDSIA